MINISQYVVKEKPLYTGSMSAYPYSPGLQALYTFKTTYDEYVCGAIKQGNTLLVPRESVPYADTTNDFRISYPIDPIECKFTPRPGQAELVEQSVNYLKQGRNHIFEASTGFGKSVCLSWIAARLGQPTIIIVSKEDLMEQWYLTLINILGISPLLIGKIQQNTCDWKDKKFAIGMAHSVIIEDRYPEEMYNYFGLLIIDEVHTMATDCFIRVCQKFTAKYRVGTSATPNRKDGKTKLLNWHIGPTLVKGNIITMKPKILVKQTGWKIPHRRKLIGNSWEYVPIPYSPGRMMTVTKAQASCESRNLEIINFVVQAYKAGRKGLVLSDLKEYHLDRLFQMLCNAGVPGNDIGYYVGGMSKLELNLTKVKPIALGTKKMCSTGTDVPSWNYLVIATPSADIKQMIGRVMRAMEGKSQPVVLDLVDYDSIFQNFHLSRLKQYHEVGADIVRIN